MKVAGPAKQELHPPRILVVEDDPESRQMMGALLSFWGYEPRLVAAGPAALEAAEQEIPEIVLLDLGLPDMDGFEVARCLRRLPGGDRLFIAALTAYRGEEYRRKAWAAGFDRYLEKPVDTDILHQLLSQISQVGYSNPEAPD